MILPDFLRYIDDELWFIESDRGNMKIHYKVKDIIYLGDSPYQNICVLDIYDFGRCLVLDGVMQTTELDSPMYNEMIAHVPIIAHQKPEKILVVGAGACGALNELTKYEFLKQIDVVEIDKMVVDVCTKEMQAIAGHIMTDERIRFYFEDASDYIKNKKAYYDIVYVDASDPVGPSKVLYEREFYVNVYDALKADGMVVSQSESPLFYKEILINLRSILRSLFSKVKTYKLVVPCFPGGIWSLTIGSKLYDPEKGDLSKLPLDTKYINADLYKSCFLLPNSMKNI